MEVKYMEIQNADGESVSREDEYNFIFIFYRLGEQNGAIYQYQLKRNIDCIRCRRRDSN